METKTESTEEQWKDSISLSSLSRSSSITSDSSDGHFVIRHFPLPKPSLSASEAQKQRESHQAYTSSVSSLIQQNHLVDLPSYDPNRIPSSVFSTKPANSTEWSIASNESLFSIHDGNFSNSTRELAAALRFEETIHEINPVPLPPLNKPKETEKKLDQVEMSDSEIEEEEEEMIELDEHEEDNMIEEEEEMIETDKQEEKEEVEDAKDNKPEDSNSRVSHSPSISCRSDNSNNSTCSFAFPLLQNEGVNKTPSMEIRGNVYQKRRPEYMLTQSPIQTPQPQSQPHGYSQPKRKTSKQIESEKQSPKASRNGWFYCFHCPLKCGIFK